MEYKETAIKGVYVIEPRVFNDERGYFFEAWKQAEFEANIGPFRPGQRVDVEPWCPPWTALSERRCLAG